MPNHVTLSSSCVSLPSFPGNTIAATGQQYDKKSGQWFGSLVQSSGDDGVILVSHARRLGLHADPEPNLAFTLLQPEGELMQE